MSDFIRVIFESTSKILSYFQSFFKYNERDLQIAVWTINSEMLKEILSSGINVNQRDENGSTHLMCAVSHGDEGIVTQLLAAGAHIDAANDDGITALMIAAATGKASIAAQLIAAGATVKQSDNNGLNALMLAVRYYGYDVIVDLLLAAGLDVNASCYDGSTALMLAVVNDDAAMVTQLLDAGAFIDTANNVGITALMIAAANGKASIVAQLLAAGADVYAMTNFNKTALMLAAEHNELDVVAQLIRYPGQKEVIETLFPEILNKLNMKCEEAMMTMNVITNASEEWLTQFNQQISEFDETGANNRLPADVLGLLFKYAENPVTKANSVHENIDLAKVASHQMPRLGTTTS